MDILNCTCKKPITDIYTLTYFKENMHFVTEIRNTENIARYKVSGQGNDMRKRVHSPECLHVLFNKVKSLHSNNKCILICSICQ